MLPAAGVALLAAQLLGAASASLRVARDHIPIPAGGSACICLNWRDTYASRRVRCGQGLEYYPATSRTLKGMKADEVLGEQFCGKFFERLNDNFCVNADMGMIMEGWERNQWCYVSPECETLVGGKRVNDSTVAWKLCGEGDHLLRHRTPEELDRIRVTHDMELGLLAKFAYPVWKKEAWPKVEQLWMQPEVANLAQGRRTGLAARHDLQRVIAASAPVVFDSVDQQAPFHIVNGTRVYRIALSENGKEMFGRGEMSKVTHLECLKDCAVNPTEAPQLGESIPGSGAQEAALEPSSAPWWSQ